MICNFISVSGKLSNAISRNAYYLLFSVLDENKSHYLEENLSTTSSNGVGVDTEDENFQESNLMHSTLLETIVVANGHLCPDSLLVSTASN